MSTLYPAPSGIGEIVETALRTRMVVSNPEDPQIIARVRHTMLPSEHLMEWYSRVGLGKSQILEMNSQQISEFVARASANEDLTHPIKMFKTPVVEIPRFLEV